MAQWDPKVGLPGSRVKEAVCQQTASQGHTGAGGPATVEQVEAGELPSHPRRCPGRGALAARTNLWTTFSTKVKSTKFFPFLQVHKE